MTYDAVGGFSLGSSAKLGFSTLCFGGFSLSGHFFSTRICVAKGGLSFSGVFAHFYEPSFVMVGRGGLIFKDYARVRFNANLYVIQSSITNFNPTLNKNTERRFVYNDRKVSENIQGSSNGTKTNKKVMIPKYLIKKLDSETKARLELDAPTKEEQLKEQINYSQKEKFLRDMVKEGYYKYSSKPSSGL